MPNESFYLKAVYNWTSESQSIVATPSPDAKQTFFYLQEAGHYYSLPGYMTERARLDSFLIVYTASGKGKLTYMGKTYSLKPGQAFFIDCMERQAYNTDPEALWELHWVHLNGATTRGYWEMFLKLNRGPVVDLGADTPLPRLILELLALHRERDQHTELVASELLLRLLTHLLVPRDNGATAEPRMPTYIQELRAMLEERYAERITLDELERRFAVSKYHLQREFKRYIGLSPNQFVASLRIARAKRLLQHSDLSVAEIALGTGFDNVSHFINLFKKQENATPLAYRKSWRPQP